MTERVARRRRTHPARVGRLTLTPEQEAQVFLESLRACHQRYAAMSPDTVSDRVWAQGYEAALKDVSAQIAERRRATLRG